MNFRASRRALVRITVILTQVVEHAEHESRYGDSADIRTPKFPPYSSMFQSFLRVTRVPRAPKYLSHSQSRMYSVTSGVAVFRIPPAHLLPIPWLPFSRKLEQLP